MATKATSVVASPAWAIIGGSVAKLPAAMNAARAPASLPVQSHTSRIESRKNGSVPRRARVRLRR